MERSVALVITTSSTWRQACAVMANAVLSLRDCCSQRSAEQMFQRRHEHGKRPSQSRLRLVLEIECDSPGNERPEVIAGDVITRRQSHRISQPQLRESRDSRAVPANMGACW